MLDVDFTEENEQFAETLVSEMVSNLTRSGRRVTGKTIDSIKQSVSRTGFIIYAAHHILTLDTGRRPTKSTTKGTPSLRDILLQWIKDRGIVPKVPDGKAIKDYHYRGLAYVMARKIHNEGNLIWRTQRPTGDILNVLSEKRIDAYIGTFSRKFMDSIRSELIAELNK